MEKDIINRNRMETVCPMTMNRDDGPFECCRDQCAWFQKYCDGNEECAIKALTYLADMIGL